MREHDNESTNAITTQPPPACLPPPTSPLLASLCGRAYAAARTFELGEKCCDPRCCPAARSWRRKVWGRPHAINLRSRHCHTWQVTARRATPLGHCGAQPPRQGDARRRARRATLRSPCRKGTANPAPSLWLDLAVSFLLHCFNTHNHKLLSPSPSDTNWEMRAWGPTSRMKHG
jgi:hypothetical protein